MLRISPETFARAQLEEHLERYCQLLELEFRGLDQHELYKLVFSRLLKQDAFRTLGAKEANSVRPTMLGADERDALLPLLSDLFLDRAHPLTILDIGAGDGQTVALVIDAVPPGSNFYLEDPNDAYLASYQDMIRDASCNLTISGVSHEPFDDYCKRLTSDPQADPRRSSVDLLLAIHMIYFVTDIRSGVNFMIDRLKVGGRALIVFADGLRGFTGKCMASYLKRAAPERYASYQATQQQLSELFACGGAESCEPSDKRLGAFLGREDFDITVKVQETRLFGHDLGDLLALGFLTGLGAVPEGSVRDKLTSVKQLVSDDPVSVGLSVETEGPRKGMWSVSEPQIVVSISRLARS
jgi:SAM-dependent methyltransferase